MINYLNCFSCSTYWPKSWKTGTLCLLVDTNQGPVLVDTGIGQQDYTHPTAITRFFRTFMKLPFDPQESAICQVARLGIKPEDIHHIFLTHMHFDHCGGLPDFPKARVHVNRREFDAFNGKHTGFTGLAYIGRNMVQHPDVSLYEEKSEKWFEFDAMRITGFEPEMWMVPLYWHTKGHSGFAIKTPNGWHFHVGDAAPDLGKKIPKWLVRLGLGPYEKRLRDFGSAHPEVTITSAHMFLDFFEKHKNNS